jgi:alanyl-tRNA synthetase
VHAFVTPIDEARRLGAMMLFGEKYGEHVRVVEVPGYSRELCGGTHVRSTAEIGPFVILSEGSVGAGARRIEAVTSGEAWALLHARAEEADELRVELERVRKDRKRAPAAASAESDVVVRRNDDGVVVAQVKALSGGALRDLSDQLKHRERARAVLLGSAVDGRAFLVVNLDPSLAEQGVDAVQVVREVAPIIGGGGGGRPTLAEAGGRDPNRLEEALAAAERHILSALS